MIEEQIGRPIGAYPPSLKHFRPGKDFPKMSSNPDTQEVCIP